MIFVIGCYFFWLVVKVMYKDNGGKVCLIEKEILILKFFYWVGEKLVIWDVFFYEVWGYNLGVMIYILEIYIYCLC